MYEEDRQTALAMYNRMFDEAESEQALLQYLVSPTRQAVILARAYNAKERKLQVHTQSRDEYEQSTDEIPDFVLAINKLQDEASALKITTPQVSEDQISLFDDSDAVTETESAPAPAAQENIEPAADEEKAGTQDADEEATVQKETPPLFADEPAEETEQDEMSNSVNRLADAVDAFLADFTISNDELIPKDKPVGEEKDAEPEKTKPAAAEETVEVSAGEAVIEQPEATETRKHVQTEPEETEAEAVKNAEEAEDYTEDAGTVRKPIVPLLILYIIIAIPLGLIGILLLLLLAFMSLSLAVTAGFFGIYGFAATFTGFAVLADILVVAGASLILLSLALLFLWLFVWFIGGGIVGLIRGLCALGGSWCYKEVAVQ